MMGWRLFNVEQIKFIADNASEIYYKELTDLFNKRFGTEFKPQQLKSFCLNSKIRTQPLNKPLGHYWTAEELQYIKNNYLGISTKELTKMINAKFKTDLTERQVFCKKKGLKLKSGVTTRFEKGCKSYPRGVGYQNFHTKEQIEFIKQNSTLSNESLARIFTERFGIKTTWRRMAGIKYKHKMKGSLPGGQSSNFKTGFKQGDINSPAYREIGSEKKDKLGIIWVKIGPNKIMQKHRYIWQQHNGKIPKGYKVVFADSNHDNFDIENLLLVSNAEMVRMNATGLVTKNIELTKAGLMTAKLMTQLGQLKKRESK